MLKSTKAPHEKQMLFWTGIEPEAGRLPGRLRKSRNAEPDGGQRAARASSCSSPAPARPAPRLGGPSPALNDFGEVAAGQVRMHGVDPNPVETILRDKSETIDVEASRLGEIEAEQLHAAAEATASAVRPFLPEAGGPSAPLVGPGAVRLVEHTILTEMLSEAATVKGAIDMILVEARDDAIGALDVVAEFAASALKPEGVLLVRAVDALMTDAVNYLGARLRVHGTVACDGPENEAGTRFFVFGTRERDAAGSADFALQASVAEEFPDLSVEDAMTAYVVERFSRPGSRVCIPMMRRGRTAIVVARRGRDVTVYGRAIDLKVLATECVQLGFKVAIEHVSVAS